MRKQPVGQTPGRSFDGRICGKTSSSSWEAGKALATPHLIWEAQLPTCGGHSSSGRYRAWCTPSPRRTLNDGQAITPITPADKEAAYQKALQDQRDGNIQTAFQ